MSKKEKEPYIEILSSCITKKKYLPFIYKHHFTETFDNTNEEDESSDESVDSTAEFEEEWLPKANILYSYTEDVDPIKRINFAHQYFHTDINYESSRFTQDAYSEDEAQRRYLASNPVSFWIIGKPGLGEKEIGKTIADHWNCVYIDPENVLDEEIKSCSGPGKCIEFNLRNGRTIGSDIIMNLVERRINSKTVQHRGFVLAGLPLIPNHFYTFDDPVATEEAVFSANETIDYLIESLPGQEVLGEGNIEENDDPDEVPLKQPANSLQNIWVDRGTITSKTPLIEKHQRFSSAEILEDNMKKIYEYFKPPFIIIYLMCPNDDVLSKRQNLRYNIYSRSAINLENLKYSKQPINILLNRNKTGLCASVVDIADENSLVDTFVNSKHLKHLVRQPSDFSKPVTVELDNYHDFILPMIDSFVIAHDPQLVIKVDGRMRISKLYNTIREKLRVLTIQNVVQAEKLIVKSTNETGEEGGEETEAGLDFEGQTPEECFPQLSVLNRIIPKFKWQMSNFRGYCPVAMREGRLAMGDPNLTIRFMNKLYFPENEDAFRLFCRNPRLYLLPPFPKPSCKMLIFGPKHCGASDLAICLNYIYGAQILNFDDILEKYKAKVERNYRHEVYLNAIVTGPDILYGDWLTRWNEGEAARKELVAAWQIKILKLYEKYNSLLPESNRIEFTSFNEILKLFPEYYAYIIDATITSTTALFTYYVEMSEFSVEEDLGEDNVNEENNGMLDYITTILEDYYVPITAEFISEAIQNPDALLPYLPSNLQPIPEPIKPPEDDSDVIEYAEKEAAEAVMNEISVSEDDIVNLCAEAIIEAEYTTALNSNGITVYGGWIITNLLPSVYVITSLIEKGFAFDEIFSFVDDDESNDFILNKYSNKRLLRPYRFMKDFLKFYGYNEASSKAPLIDLPSEEIAEYILDYILGRDWFDLCEIITPELMGEGEDFIDGSTPAISVMPTAVDMVATSSTNENYDLLEEEDLQPVNSFLILLDWLNAYTEGWKELEPYLVEENINIIRLSYPYREMGDIMHEALLELHKRYQTQPELYSEEDKEAELLEGKGDMLDEEVVGDEEGESVLTNRLFGDTKDYCPIALYKHGVLWKGRDQFTVQFKGKLYLLSSENAMNEFMANPRLFVPLLNSPNIYPKLRICLTGPIGVGKTVLAKRLCSILGVAYVNFFELMDSFLIPSGYPLPGRKNKSVYLNLNAPPESEMTPDLETQEEFLSIVNQYLSTGVPMPDEFMQLILFRLWKHEPYVSTGFVLDGFPTCDSDFKFMESYYLIPTFILKLETHQGLVQSRLIESRLENWKNVMEKVKAKKENANQLELKNYNHLKEIRIPQIIDQIFNEKAMAFIESEEFNSEQANESGLSPIQEVSENEEVYLVLLQQALEVIKLSANEEEIAMEALDRFENENPEPQFDDQWESEEAALERLTTEIDEWYEAESTAMANFSIVSKELGIPLIDIDSTKNVDKVFLKIIHSVSNFIFTNPSFYETMFEISIEEAEALLRVGYFFLSRFGRTCPVQTYIESCPIQLFLPLEQKMFIYPVIHRQYIYFIAGKDYLELFKEDPLKYIYQEKPVLPLIPLRVSVIGPPKCGKSTLACRFKKEFGLKVVTRGQSIRFVLEEYPQSSLAKEIDANLRSGDVLRFDLVKRAVDACCFDGRAVSQGIVFDGFPQCDDEYMELAALGLTPHLIIDYNADIEYSHKCLASENSLLKYMPLYSQVFLDYRYHEWEKENTHFQEWAWNNYQNTHSIQCKFSKWSNWTEAKKIVCNVFTNIINYVTHMSVDMPWKMEYMCISPAEFRDRQSSYLNYCPCCFILHRKLNQSTPVPPRTNMFQFNHHYYYICDDHVTLFLEEAKFFLPPINTTKLPRELPKELLSSEQTRNVPPLFQNGYCIVTFWDKQPDHCLVRGLAEFSAIYKGQTYRFCSKECLEIFLSKPHAYVKLKIHFQNKKKMSPIVGKNLPTLGFLQQYESKIITQACTNTGILRPKYPCLSPELSAIVNVGLYLKIHNSKTSIDELNIYEKYLKRFKLKCRQLITVVALSKRIINPNLKYPVLVCEKKAVVLPSITTTESSEIISEAPAPQFEYEGEEEEENERDSLRSHLISISFHSSELALLTVDMDEIDD